MAIKRHIRVSFVVALMIAAGIFLPRLVSTREKTREVRVVARDMAYYVDGIPTMNPALRFTPGEQVRITFRNEDKGMQHDFRIPAWKVGTGIVPWSTEKSTTFRVPVQATDTVDVTYICTPHAAMMSGKVVLQQ
jgi:plastocyanin